LARQREAGDRPAHLPEDELDRVAGPEADFLEIALNQDIAQLLAYYDALHERALAEFATINEVERTVSSLWWEEEAVSLQYRLHRFDAHLRQHTIQMEKALAASNQPLTEVKRLLRLIYHAAADVENNTLGAPGLGSGRLQALAESIVARAEAVTQRVAQARQMMAAVSGGDLDQVETLLADEPDLVDAVDQNHLSAVLTAAYRRHQGIVEALVTAGAWLSIFEAAAIGRLDVVKREVERWAELLNAYNRDGFTPLQLACFFGHESMALWLIERGADVNAVARNDLRIAPIHAAAANDNLTLLAALLRHGAEVNARQQDDFTPLHTAADHGNAVMAQLLLEHGADINAATGDGRTPLDLALAKGHDGVAGLLR
jgi:ankyrin repeat protein